jgi:hypothetical protein
MSEWWVSIRWVLHFLNCHTEYHFIELGIFIPMLAQRHDILYYYTKCHSAKCRYAEYPYLRVTFNCYTECHFIYWCIFIPMLSAMTFFIIIQSVIQLNVIMQSIHIWLLFIVIFLLVHSYSYVQCHDIFLSLYKMSFCLMSLHWML